MEFRAGLPSLGYRVKRLTQRSIGVLDRVKCDHSYPNASLFGFLSDACLRFRDITSITQPSPAFSLWVDALQNRRKKQRQTEKTATGSFAPTVIIPYERPWHFASVGVPTNVRYAPRAVIQYLKAFSHSKL
jgi:hypothetical protein